MKNTTPKESEEQIAFIKYCDLHHIMAISTQNGMYIPKKSDDGKKDFNHFGYIRRQKAMGLRKGFLDIVIFAQNRTKTHEVFCLEMKRTQGGKLKPEQEEWIEKLDTAGYMVGIAFGCDAAIRCLHKYLES